MNAIDRVGTFRGTPQDWGVSETKNGFPQFVVRIKAEEFYDEEQGQYIPWAEYDQEITGYLVLYTKDKTGQWVELLNAQQLKKVFGWSGLDFESLAGGQYGNTIVLFRVEENEYNGKTTLQLQWLDVADASPTKTLKKLDASKLKELTSKMGGALSAHSQKAPAKAPASAKPATPPKRGPGRPPKGTPAGAPASPPAALPVASTPPAGAPVPMITVPSGNPVPQTTETKISAWEAVCTMSKVPEEKLAEVWIAEVTKIGKAEDQFTSADWTIVKKLVNDQTAIF